MKILLRIFMLGVLVLLARCAAPDEHGSEARLGSQAQALGEQPFVSAEFSVDGPPVRQLDPAARLLDVAANDDGYLLTYANNGLTFVRWNAATGSLSTFATLPIAGYVYGAHAVAVGDGWLVVYQTGTRFSVTIAADGTVSSPTAIPGTCQYGITGLARSPTTALLVDGCGVGVLLDLDGQLLRTFFLVPPLDLQNPPMFPFAWSGHVTGGQVAFNGIDYVAMYAYSSYIYPKAVGVIRVSPSGDVAPVLFVASPAVPYKGVDALGLAANGSTFLLLLKQHRTSGPEFNIVYKTMEESAAHTFTLGTETLLTTPPGSTFEPSDRNATAFALGSRFGIVREDRTGALSLLVVDPANVLPTTTQALLPPFAGAPVALTAATASGFVVAAGPRGVRFDSAIAALDVPAATVIQHWLPAPAQSVPSFAFSGGSYLAGWLEGVATNNPSGVFLQRLSNNGQILEPASVPLSPDTRYGERLVMNADSKGFVLAWSGVGGVPAAGGARISPNDPFVITSFPPPSSGYISGSAIASDGDRAAAVWSGDAVQMARFSETGAWSPSLLIADTVPPHRSSTPALAFHEGHFVVLWLDATDALDGFAIYGARVAPDLSLIDAIPKEVLRITAPSPRSLEVVSVGDELVLAWSGLYYHGNDPMTEEIYTARLSSALQVIDPGAIRVATPQPWGAAIQGRTALRWDGSNVWLLWMDAARGAATRGGLVGQRFSAALAPVDTAPWLVTDNLDNRASIALTGGEDGRSLIGYTVFDPDLSSARVRARFLSAAPFADGIPCATASQCRNNACSASYCATDSGTAGAGGQTGGVAGGGECTGGIANGGGGNAPSGGADANGGTFTGGGASNEAGQVGVAGTGLPTGGSGGSNPGDGGSPADAGESNGGTVTSGGAAGSPGHHSGNCSAAGPSSSQSRLSGLLLLATTLTLARRRRPRPGDSRAGNNETRP